MCWVWFLGVIKKSILFLFIFFIAFGLFALAKMPAHMVWEKGLKENAQVKSLLREIGISINGVNGTIWDGGVLFKYKGISSILNWDIQFSEIYSLTLPLDLALESQAGEIDAELLLGLSSLRLLLSNGDIELSMLNPALRAQRVTLDGQLLLKDIELLFEGEKVQSAKGLLSWSGGDISYPAQRAVHKRNMPAFRGVLETVDLGSIKAGIRDSGGAFDVIEASVTPEGEAMVKVKRRLLDLADEFWPKNSNEQDVVFKMKKVIY